MSAHTKSRKLVPLAAVLCLMVAAAFGGYAVAGSRAPQTVALAGASGGSGQDMTIHACLASGKLTHVSVAAAPKCPAKAVPIQWVAQGVLPSQNPSSGSPPSAAPNPSSSSSSPPPSSSGAGAPCVTAGLSGTCGPYRDPDITAADGYNTDVANNMWGCGSVQPGQPGAYCGRQTVTSYGPGDWSVTSDQKAGNTGVLTYPDVAQVFTLSQ